jgi:hypothetical protein
MGIVRAEARAKDLMVVVGSRAQVWPPVTCHTYGDEAWH